MSGGFGQAREVNEMCLADAGIKKITTYCRVCNVPILAYREDSDPRCDEHKGVKL